jgi:hypothetical protein
MKYLVILLLGLRPRLATSNCAAEENTFDICYTTLTDSTYDEDPFTYWEDDDESLSLPDCAGASATFNDRCANGPAECPAEYRIPPMPSTRSPRDGVVAPWTYPRRRPGTPLSRRPGTPRSNARKAIQHPLESVCGGKSVASKTLSNNHYSRNRSSSPPSAPISWGGR